MIIDWCARVGKHTEEASRNSFIFPGTHYERLASDAQSILGRGLRKRPETALYFQAGITSDFFQGARSILGRGLRKRPETALHFQASITSDFFQGARSILGRGLIRQPQ